MLWERAGVCVPIQIIRKQKNKLGENYQLLPSRGQGQLCWRRLESAGQFRAWGWLQKALHLWCKGEMLKAIACTCLLQPNTSTPRETWAYLCSLGVRGHCCTEQSLRLHGNFSWVFQLPPQDLTLPGAVYPHSGNAQQCLLLSQGRVPAPTLSCSTGTPRPC